MNNYRQLSRVITAQAASDGDGVSIHRIAGREVTAALDPFLLLDEIRSDQSSDYVGGFPPHPHRGFETITYMLQGAMRHEDHMGNVGHLADGGVQWMTAGRGVIHSEMPEQTEGLLHGFQLWLNLPAAQKMQPSGYCDYHGAEFPQVAAANARIKVIAGEFAGMRSPVPARDTAPVYLDVELPAGAAIDIPVAAQQQAMFYVYEGATTELRQRQMGCYSQGDTVHLVAGERGARGLFLAGSPLREPVYQHGPFVMNSAEEIRQAVDDYNNGRLVAA